MGTITFIILSVFIFFIIFIIFLCVICIMVWVPLVHLVQVGLGVLQSDSVLLLFLPADSST